MTLPVSPNAISFSAISAEFGGSNPVGMDEYYGRGIPILPASGQISVSDFHGLTDDASVTWALASLATLYTDLGGLTLTYSVNISFQADGTVDVFRGQAADLLNEVNPYVSPIAATVGTYVRCTHVSGNDMTAGDARGVWHRLNVQRNFTMQIVSPGGASDITGTFNFELSSEADGTPVEATKNNVVVNVGELF